MKKKKLKKTATKKARGGIGPFYAKRTPEGGFLHFVRIKGHNYDLVTDRADGTSVAHPHAHSIAEGMGYKLAPGPSTGERVITNRDHHPLG